MTNPLLDRRGLLVGAALIGAAGTAGAQATPPPAISFTARPLPFDPTTIVGLSEKLLTSHHDNNYMGAVKRLGAIETAINALDPATAANFTLNGLKREELIAWNSMILHEIYFAGLGVASQPGTKLAAAIERDFGSQAKWAAQFSAMGKALGGGSGWVVLNYSHRDDRLVNQWANDHTMSLAGGSPILVMDMFEHAYAMDYGAKAGAYVEAFMKIINWGSADARYAKAST